MKREIDTVIMFLMCKSETIHVRNMAPTLVRRRMFGSGFGAKSPARM